MIYSNGGKLLRAGKYRVLYAAFTKQQVNQMHVEIGLPHF